MKKILIANRGEIACRIIRTAKKMGISVVAIYSESDVNAIHVREADEAVFVGDSPSDKSYLSIPNILNAIRQTNADAVHPGYGFLSENYEFVSELEKHHITFIGPGKEAIFTMGDKISSKKLAQEAGVAITPGYMGTIESVAEAKEIANDIGYPIMLKASAGGGGKGMRVVHKESEIQSAYNIAKNEAKNSFGDDRIFIEKFIINPRHIEVQILADAHGNVVCLGERECSIQRHNQKVIEEAPSSFVTPEIRKELYRQSILLAKAVNYKSAGTIEYIMEESGNFYFLEMNTRLQVEHPVTELVTGYDIVEQMIHIARGQKLSFSQEDIKLTGSAIEARIYAEDPTKNFLPSCGRITRYSEPSNLRIDTGVYEGLEITPYYDSMISKSISYGNTRKEAIDTMLSGLSEYVVEGITHNIQFLESIFQNERFVSGNISTSFIKEEYEHGFQPHLNIQDEDLRIFVASATYIYLSEMIRKNKISDQISPQTLQFANLWVIHMNDVEYPIDVHIKNENEYNIHFHGENINVKSEWQRNDLLFICEINDEELKIKVQLHRIGLSMFYRGQTVYASISTPRIASLRKYMQNKKFIKIQNDVKAPMSGRISNVLVNQGDRVNKDDSLFMIEAMKMENIISAEGNFEILDVHIKPGDIVTIDQKILSINVIDE